jgi:2Fe-2S ferredoxin
MPRLTCLVPGGRHDLDVSTGDTVMLAAQFAKVPGMVGACGGVLGCASCHVYVHPGFASRIPPPSTEELEMLRHVSTPRRTESRLACQIVMTDALDGLVVKVPPNG